MDVHIRRARNVRNLIRDQDGVRFRAHRAGGGTNLLDLTFLRHGTNLVLISNPGVGKTFLARVFGWKACQANQRVLFTTTMDMLNHTLGYLVDRYRARATAEKAAPDKWVFARTDGSGLPLWDSGVRQALKRAAVAEGCDFPGLGPHSFRRANITWRQEVGGSSIEASKIAGHSTVRIEEYTKIQLTRQDTLTRLIQDRLASAGEKLSGGEDDGNKATESPSSKLAEPDWTVGGIQTIQ